MTNHEHPSESDPSQPYNDVAAARKALVETITAHTHDLLRHEHPLIKIAADLVETGQVKPPYPTGDGSTLPPKLREYVRRSLIEEALWEVRRGTPPSPETPQ